MSKRTNKIAIDHPATAAIAPPQLVGKACLHDDAVVLKSRYTSTALVESSGMSVSDFVKLLTANLPRALITVALAGAPMAAFAVDTDGDGLDDSIDTDDDNDGIPDSYELLIVPGQAGIEWTHNVNNGSSVAGVADPATGSFAAIGDMTFASGFVQPTSTWAWKVYGADSATLADAKLGNDYTEISFVPSMDGMLTDVQHGLVGSIWGGTLAGLYETTVEISSDNFATSTVVYNDGYMGDPALANYTVSTRTSTPAALLSGTEYKVRFYIYNEQNNINSNFVEWDDVQLSFELNDLIVGDSDGDGIDDHLDPDSDGDGIPDAVEGIADTDGDGIPNFQDLDSDGDGILDIDESPALGIDSDGDGIDDYYDVDATGGIDADGDGVDDAIEASAAIDSDGDGIPDHLDTDVAPVATDDIAVVAAATAAVVDLADNITDANADADIATIDLDPTVAGVFSTYTTADGAWSVDSVGVVTFTPNVGFEGNAAITYTVTDAAGLVSNVANITVNVAGAAPQVTNDSDTVAADTVASVDLSDNVSDANNDVDITTIDLDPTAAGIQNSLTTVHGYWTVDAAGLVNFDPVPSFEGTSNIAYTVADDDGNIAPSANVSVTVGGASPQATNDSTTVATSTTASIDLSDNVTDANGDLDISTIDLDPTSPGIQNTLTTIHGTWAVDAGGMVTFDPVPSFEGTSTIAYSVEDDGANVSAPANVSVTVGGATPQATNDSVTVAAGSIASIDLSDNVTDANNDVDITTIDLDPTTPGIQNTLTTAHGDWAVDATGIVTFDPVPSFEGTSTISYTVEDDDGNVSAIANVSVTVAGAIPQATNDSVTVAADTIASIDLSDNVSDANNDVDIATIDLDPTVPGIQNTLTTIHGTWAVDAAGMVTFDPVPGFEGPSTIAYGVEDDDGNIAVPANVTVTVGGATPQASNDSATVAADTIAAIDLSDNVTDANSDVDISTIDLDPTSPGIQNTLTTVHGTWVVDANGMVTFDSVPSFEGTSTIAYTVEDDDINISNSANVSVTVGGATPQATNDAVTVVSDAMAVIDLSDNVSDANSDVDITTIDLDPSAPGIQNILTTIHGTWAVDAAGIVTFDPVPGFEGTSTIAYTVEDDDGNIAVPANVAVTVGGATPQATNDAVTGPADTLAAIDLSDNVTDANSDVDITTIDLDPTSPGIQNTLTTIHGTWTVDAAGLVTFDPVSSFEGTSTIAYTVEDDDGNISVPANVSVTVGGATPIATDDSTSVLADVNAVVDLTDNVTDANSDVDITTIDLDPTTAGIQNTLTTAEGDWSVDAAGIVTFDPALGFEGTTTTPYTVSDDDGNVASAANVSVTVAGASPIATNDAVTVAAATIASVDLSDNVSDINSDLDITTIDLDPTAAGIQNTLTTSHGTWTVDSTGMLVFVPIPGFEGTSTIAYTVLDVSGNVAVPANVSVTVGGATPIATADSASVLADTNAFVDLSDNVTDANNDIDITTIDLDPSAAGVQSTLTTADGAWSVDAAGIVTFDPVAAFEGSTSISYTVQDDDGNVSVAANIVVIVAGAAPITTADSAVVIADTNAIVDLADNVTDVNSNADITTIDLDPTTLGIQSTLTTADGDWSVDASGTVTFDPNLAFSGSTTIQYAVTDADGNVSLPSDITVIVGSASPIADSDVKTTVQNVAANIDVLAGDTDANSDIDSTSIDLDPASAGVQSTMTVAGEGVYEIVGGQVVFTPNAAFFGSSSIDYTVSDAAGNTSNVANIAVTVLVDTDGDGVANIDDIDDDNDGIPDSQEGSNDTDGDGIVDTLDLDSDNDGITDTTEAGGYDIDGNGIADSFIDTDSDGLNDYIAATPLTVQDTDADGMPDYLDLDSDNDGLTDTFEGGGTDTDGDGKVDGYSDTNADGFDDASAALASLLTDTDTDGIADYIDADSDNDGIPDTTEAGGVDADGDGVTDNFTDANSDGLDDAIAAAPLPAGDFDADNHPDHLDQDSDADGIPDAVEAGVAPTAPADTDGDGAPDYLQLDSDSDGISDAQEAGSNPSVPFDTDSDGTADYIDSDSDNDGIPDSIEGTVDTDADGVPDYLDSDSDNDGIPDSVEAGASASNPVDTDGDGTADYREQDSDNDGITDTLEAGVDLTSPVDTDGDGTADYLELDSDQDGIPDSIEAGADPTAPADTDADGTPDYLEQDSDGDGLSDTAEVGGDPANPVDTDGDGTPDYQEIFVEPAPVVDTDSDNDGIPNSVEGTEDIDGDGVADYLDLDSDNDGISDRLETALDTDADGVADYRDLDSDNDGIFDLIEVRIGLVDVNLLDTDNDGRIDIGNPYGANGMADIVETSFDSGEENYLLPDTDGDNVLDFRDLDSDNDGLLDALESDHVDQNLNGVVDTVAVVRRTVLVVDALGVAADAGGLPRNTDGDGLADFRDGDSDNDGILDIVESFGLYADADNDGMLDDFIDADDDGVDDNWQVDIIVPTDTDNDGQPDAIELDSDGDGVADIVESGNVDIDGDGTIDNFYDADVDGIDDSVAVVPVLPIDTDGDGFPDYQDLDSDNDGSSDLEETGGIDTDGNGQADTDLGAGAALIDTNVNATPDFQELEGGFIHTGLQGSGCAIATQYTADGKPVVDPTLPALGMFALMSLAMRRRIVRVVNKSLK